MVRPTLLPSAALYLLTTAATTAASPLSTTSSSPSSNLLDYAVSAGTSPTFSTSGGSCGASVSSGAWLSLPGAHIDHRAAGSVDCGVGLALRGLPTGYRFSVSRAEVKGYLDLEDGCYLEKVEVRVAGGAVCYYSLLPRISSLFLFFLGLFQACSRRLNAVIKT